MKKAVQNYFPPVKTMESPRVRGTAKSAFAFVETGLRGCCDSRRWGALCAATSQRNMTQCAHGHEPLGA